MITNGSPTGEVPSLGRGARDRVSRSRGRAPQTGAWTGRFEKSTKGPLISQSVLGLVSWDLHVGGPAFN